MKYDIDYVYSTKNTVNVTTSQTGSKAMILEKGKDIATLKQGFRVSIEFEGKHDTICCGKWNESEKDVLLKAVKYEYYKAKAYQELYYNLVQKLNSIGLVFASEIEELDERI